MADIRELYARRLEAASIAQARGDRSEAERLFHEALAMGEENFGKTSADLAVPLNELARHYVHLSAHARAEPLLERLLQIRRADGEKSPGVATVLAALAAVRHGLGDDAAAEKLYRRALAIREVAHAPEHMAVIVTLEQLADICAVRGNAVEAWALYERALPVREKALGVEHATVVGLRARMAALAPRNAPLRLDATTPAVVPVPVPAPASVPVPVPEVAEAPASNQLVFIYEPEKPVRRASVKRDRAVTPPFSSMAVAAASIIAAPASTAVSVPSSAPVQVAAPSLAPRSPRGFDTPAQTSSGGRHVRHGGEGQPANYSEPAPRFDVTTDVPRMQAKRYAFAAAGMTIVASGLFFASSRATGKATPASAPVVATVPTTPVPAPSVIAVSPPAVARVESGRAVSVAPVRVTAVATDKVKSDAVPSLSGTLPTIGAITVPVNAVVSSDSVIRGLAPGREAYADQILPAARLRSPVLADDRSETAPVLIGSVPQPRFPDALRSQQREGAVVVQFLVGADGRVDASSMKVVRSPHELFTSAVRAVLPKFRFEAARAADGKTRAEWVQYSIQFSAAK